MAMNAWSNLSKTQSRAGVVADRAASQPERTRIIVPIVGGLLVALFGAFVWLHLATPFDGARLQPGQPAWRTEGVVATPLEDEPDGLRRGDIVVAVAGQSLEFWTQALFRWGINRPRWQVGQTVDYTIVRNGQRLDVAVTLKEYPLLAVARQNWGTIVFALVYELVALYVLLRRPHHRAARVLFISASSILSATTWSLGLQISDIVGGLGFWLYKATSLGAYTLFWIAGLHFTLIFPRPLPPVLKYPRLIPLIYILPYVWIVGYLAAIWPGAASTLNWLSRWATAEAVPAAGLLALHLISVIWQYRANVAGITRQQIRWVVFGALLAGGFGFIFYIVPGALGLGQVDPNLMGLIVLAFPLAIAVAIVRHNLFDIDTLLNRALVYGALTAGVAAVYVLVVGLVSVGLRTNSHLVGILVTTVLAVALFRPLRTQVQRSVDRLTYGAGEPRRDIPPVKPANDVQTVEKTAEGPGETAPALLPGRWLTLARLVWVALVVLAIGLWITGTFAYANEPPPSCAAATCDPFEFSAEDLAVLQNLHLPPGFIVRFWAVMNIGLSLVFFAIAGLIFWRKSDDWLGLLVSFTLVFLGAVFFTDSDDALWRTYTGLRLPLAIVYTLGFTALMLFLFYFPDGRFVPRRRPARIAVLLLILLTTPLFATATRAVTLGTLPLVGTICLGLAAQIYRYRRVSGPVQRQQTKWVMLGLAASVVVILIWVFIGANFPPDRPGPARLYLLFLTRSLISILIPLLPVSIAFSILHYRLWDIDFVFNRALLFGALTALIVALYVVVVGAFGALFQASGNLLVSLLATGLAALLFQPLRERLQRGVNRLMYGEGDDPYAVLSRLSRRLEASLTPEATLITIVETVAQALKLPYVAIALRHDEGRTTKDEGQTFVTPQAPSSSEEAFKTVAAYGLLVDQPLTLPLIYQSESIGRLILAPRTPGEPFTPAEQRLLADIAHQAGVAAHAVRLTNDLQQLAADLQHARQGLVAAREEERRRLRRDLHDGLGPHLASQMLTIEAISKLLQRDPAQAAALLQDLKHQAQVAISDIRRLVHDLRPPALDDLGLVAALREGATRYQQSGLQISIDAPERLPPLPAAVEVAAYRIAQEALTNVVRHAQARTCQVQLSLNNVGQSQHLYLEIRDDGRGLPRNYRAGVGCQSMRERAAEVGGQLVSETRKGGGTRVAAWLPLGEEAA